jgi:hypothetical protein
MLCRTHNQEQTGEKRKNAMATTKIKETDSHLLSTKIAPFRVAEVKNMSLMTEPNPGLITETGIQYQGVYQNWIRKTLLVTFGSQASTSLILTGSAPL